MEKTTSPMSDFKGLQMDIASSLWAKPGSFKELKSREFLETKGEKGVDMLLNHLMDKGWIYQRGSTYFTYKETVTTILNPAGYELKV